MSTTTCIIHKNGEVTYLDPDARKLVRVPAHEIPPRHLVAMGQPDYARLRNRFGLTRARGGHGWRLSSPDEQR